VSGFFSNHPLFDGFPEKFAASPSGFSEIRGDPSYFVFREQKNGYDFMLVTDQSQFKSMEKRFFRAVLLFSLIVTGLGFIWGRIFYRMVMNPVSRLAEEVTRASLSPHYVPVKVPPKQDAISVLASCCDTALKKLHSALSRERSYTGDVSHEIRNPLNVIEGSLELLELSDLTDKQRRQVKRAGVAAGFLQLLIEDFLSMARDSSKISASGDDTLSVVFDHMREVWTPEAQKRGLALKIEKDRPMPRRVPRDALGQRRQQSHPQRRSLHAPGQRRAERNRQRLCRHRQRRRDFRRRARTSLQAL
jgi:signal transduction histidine kinase